MCMNHQTAKGEVHQVHYLVILTALQASRQVTIGNAQRCSISSVPKDEFTSSLNTKLHNFSSASQARCGGHCTAAGLGDIQADTVTIVSFHLGHSEFLQQEMEHKQKVLKTSQTWINKNPKHLLIKAHQKTVYFIYTTLLGVLRMPNEARDHWKILLVWSVHFTFRKTGLIYPKYVKYSVFVFYFVSYFSLKWYHFI